MTQSEFLPYIVIFILVAALSTQHVSICVQAAVKSWKNGARLAAVGAVMLGVFIVAVAIALGFFMVWVYQTVTAH